MPAASAPARPAAPPRAGAAPRPKESRWADPLPAKPRTNRKRPASASTRARRSAASPAATTSVRARFRGSESDLDFVFQQQRWSTLEIREKSMEPDEKQITQEYMRSVTIPLFYQEKSQTGIAGSACLFTISDRHFLITAKHIIDKTNPSQWLFVPHRNRDNFEGLGKLDIHTAQQEYPDVAVIELLSSDKIATLKTGWRFLTLDNIASATHKPVFFVLLGYPVALEEPVGDLIRGKVLALHAFRLEEAPSGAKDLNPDCDLFFDHQTRAMRDDDGSEVEVPALQGASGSAVWELQTDVEGVWAPEKIAKVVGVQSGYIAGKYFRAMAWSAVAAVFRDFAPESAELI